VKPKRCPLGSWTWDFQANRQYWSDEIFDIFGLGVKKPDFQHDDLINLVHPDDKPAALKEIRLAMRNHLPYSVEYRIIRPDGAVRYLYTNAEVVYDGSGKPVKMLGTIHDVTESKQAQEEIIFRAKLLDSATDSVIVISHDNKTIMYTNETACRSLKYSKEELFAETCRTLLLNRLRFWCLKRTSS